MAINEKVQNTANDGMSLVKSVLGISPLVGAAFYGFGKLKSNEAINIPMHQPTPIKTLNRTLSINAQRLSVEEKKVLSKQSVTAKESIMKQFSQADSLRTLFESSDKKNALLHSLALVLDDPALGIEESKRTHLKGLLNDAANTRAPQSNEVLEDIGKIATAIVDSSSEVAIRFNKLNQQFSEIGSQLVPAGTALPLKGQAYNTLGSNLSGNNRANQLATRLQKSLGSKYSVEIKAFSEVDNSTSHLGQIFENFGAKKVYKGSVPLGGTLYRPGETARTLYSMPVGAIDVARANVLGPKDKLGKAYVSMPEYFVQQIEQRARSGNLDWRDIKTAQYKFLTNVDRIAGTGKYGAHVVNQAKNQSGRLALVGLEKMNEQEQIAAYTNLATRFPQTINPAISVKSMLYRSDQGTMGNVGLQKNSLFQHFQNLFGWEQDGQNVINRSSVPLTMRESQLTGRTGAFVGSHFDVGKGFVGGSILNASGANMDAVHGLTNLGGHVSGSEGALMVYDLGGRLSSGGLGGEGLAFTGKRRLIRTPLNFTISDPESHGHLSSDLLRRLREAGDAGLNVSKAELRAGTYLGESANGAKHLPWEDATQNIFLKINDVTESHVFGGMKKEISLAGFEDRYASSFKAFSLTAKGNVETIRGKLFGQESKETQETLGSLFKHLAVDEASTVYADSSMLGKGAVNMLWQLTHGTVAVSNGKMTFDQLRTNAQKIASAVAGGSTDPILGVYKGMDENTRLLAYYAHAAMDGMHHAGIDPKYIGLAVSGVYHGAEGKGKYSVGQSTIETLAKNLFGKDPVKYKAFTDTLALKKAIGFDFLSRGEGNGDYGRARLGVEPRFLQTLQERMMSIGFNTNEAADIVAKVHGNKLGVAKHYELAAGLMDMTSSMHGGLSAKNFMTTKANRVYWNDLISNGILGVDNKNNTLADFLKTQEHGIVVDFSKSSEALQRTVRSVFGTNELALPGASVFANAKETSIKMAGSTSAVLDSHLGQLMNSLQGRILEHQTEPQLLQHSLQTWKKEATSLVTGVVSQLQGGKIKGAVSALASIYDLNYQQPGITDKAFERLRSVGMKSKTPVALQTGESFLSQMYDKRGTEPIGDLAIKAQRFFTSMEIGDKGKSFYGLAGLMGRDPVMSSGNVQFSQTFRQVEEVTALGGTDTVYEKLLSNAKGREILEKHFGSNVPQSFADPQFRTRKAHRFFQDIMKNLDHFTNGENADIIKTLGMKTTTGEGLGSWVQAGGDNDGDHLSHVLFDSPTANRVMKRLKANRDTYATEEFTARVAHNELVGQAKGAIGDLLARSTGDLKASAQLKEDILKEIGLSMHTGSLDVSLRGPHMALLNYEQDPIQKSMGRNMLGVLQEHFVIKSKKLQKYSAYPERITSAFSKWGEMGTEESFQEVSSLMKEIFGQQQIANGGIEVNSQNIQLAGDPALQAMFEKNYQGKSFKYTLDDFLNTTHRAIKQSVAQGTNKDFTQGQMNRGFTEDPIAAVNRMISSDHMAGFLGPEETAGARTALAVDSLREGFAKVDSHMTGRLALGALASAAAFSMLNGGMAPAPIIMPGEGNPSNRVAREIAGGNLFDNREAQVTPEQMIPPQNSYDTMAPINTGMTFVNRPNSYQIRGEVGSGAGLSTFSSYFNQLTGGQGRGVITVNDQRRPITRNYVDRLLGD